MPSPLNSTSPKFKSISSLLSTPRPMQLLSIVLTLALAAVANADINHIQLECPGPEWALYRERYEVSCLKLMPEPKLFLDAFKACHDSQSRLLSLLHKRHKINFVNDLIINSGAGNRTMWFFDPLDVHHDLVKKEPVPPKHPSGVPHAGPAVDVAPRWLVISPNADKSKIELLVNMTAVPRLFVCEAPASPAAQRAQLEREPEDAFISEELLKEAAGRPAADKHPPFVITFNCQAFGIPKPTVSWVLTADSGADRQLIVEHINATTIHDPRLPVTNTESGVRFFNLQRDCKIHACPSDNIQERSQLIVLNPHLLDTKMRVACIARNDFGSVLSREAQIHVTRLGNFANETANVVTVKTGLPIIVHNAITADPDAASFECFRVLHGGANPAKLITMEEVNRITHGAIQISKATFDIVIDAAAPEDAGQFVCHARLHNGRLGHVTRERVITLDVKPCPMADPECNLADKPVAVAPGFPAALSMNPLSNRVIRAGDDFLLECPCTGKRHPQEVLSVSWNLNNRTDLPAIAIPLLPLGSALLIHGANAQMHSGHYHCRCVRGADVSNWSSVAISVLPSVAPADLRDLVRVKAGQSATMNCSVPADTGSGVETVVQPLRGARPLTEALPAADTQRFNFVQTSANQFSLSIAGVKEADSDVYGCRVIANYSGKWVDYNTYYTTLLVDKARR